MNPLNRKLWRNISKNRGQFLAIMAVILVGVSMYIAMNTAYFNLNQSTETFYEEHNFADYYFHVVRAPEIIVRQIEAVPGVTQATGRIQTDVPLLKADNQRATARLVGYPFPLERQINRFFLMSGRAFEKDPHGGQIEVILDPQFTAANRLAVNDTVTIVAEGKPVPLTVVGSATSPEFVYPMQDAASLLPEPELFGIFMLPQNQLQQILNLNGQINQVVIKLAPGADETQIAEQVKAILKPYGNLADYPRKQQLSNAALEAEIDGLRTMSDFLPLVFLLIAAAIQFIMLGRMIKTQRLQIGVMKALGYSSWQIMWHYTGYALSIAVCGALIGSVLGIWFASIISETYGQYFNLPTLIGGVNYQAVVYGLVLSLGIGTAAGLTAARRIVTIKPAESMRPEPPHLGGRTWLEGWSWFWRRLSSGWKMSLRTISRNRLRTGITLLGVVFAVGMLVVSFFADDSMDYMLNKHFTRERRYDHLVRFTHPIKANELLNITRLEGVYKAEPVLEIPVKVSYLGQSEDDLLTGLPLDVTLKSMFNPEDLALNVPEEGILLNEQTARKLGVRPGEEVEIETRLSTGPTRRATLKVAEINRPAMGGGSYLSLTQANRILAESQVISGVMLKVDPGQASRIEAELSQMTQVASILSVERDLANYNKNLEIMIYYTSIMILFSVVLGFAIVYNASVISFAERRRELASLRVLGFSVREVSSLLLKENLLQALIGVALGLPFGRLIVDAYVQSVTTDLFTFQAVVYPKTYVLSALGGIFFIMLAYLFAVRSVKRLNLVEVLKNTE